MRRFAILAAACLALGFASPLRAADPEQVKRGAYLFAAADCVGCHTDVKGKGKPLAGGRPLPTPFGTFYTPNVTPDRTTGIGGWSLGDFTRALRQGVAPDGSYYYPAFPYTAFTGMTDEDIADIYAYLMTQEPVAQPNRKHDLSFPFSVRRGLVVWRRLYFREGPIVPASQRDEAWNRGRYLAEGVVHCQECHTPRDWLGGLDDDRPYAGDPKGPDNQKTPNITPDPATGIGKWSLDDVVTVLKSGQTPDNDFVGGTMGEVVKGTSQLSEDDLKAIATYIRSLRPIATPKKS